jgi:hypothetical protein
MAICEKCEISKTKGKKFCSNCGKNLENVHSNKTFGFNIFNYGKNKLENIRDYLDKNIENDLKIYFEPEFIFDIKDKSLNFKINNTNNFITHNDNNFFKLNVNYGQNYRYKFYIYNSLSNCDINFIYFEFEKYMYEVMNNNKIINNNNVNEYVEQIIDSTSYVNRKYKNELNIEKLLKMLIKNKISNPIIANGNNMIITKTYNNDQSRPQPNKHVDEYMINIFEKESDTRDKKNYYKTKYFKFLDNINETLYYSPSKDKIFLLNELKEHLGIELKKYKINLNKNCKDFNIRGINIKILNEDIDKLFRIADIRINYFDIHNEFENKYNKKYKIILFVLIILLIIYLINYRKITFYNKLFY